MNRVAGLVLLAATSVLAGAQPSLAAGGGVIVPIDEVRLVSFPKPVTTVYVGNTTIADVTMVDSRHAFLLGKEFGQTNLIALSADGNSVANDHVTVLGHRVGMVTVNRGPDQFNYSCTAAHCEVRPVPGDPKAFFDNTHDAIKTQEDMGLKAAAATPNSNPNTPAQ
jgi:Pilus formation protein N terminal region